jgi:hypothetical protein
MKLFANDAPLRAVNSATVVAQVGMARAACAPLLANGNRMKTLHALSLVLLVALPAFARAADSDGVALGIVYDTSGSMHEPVTDTNGHRTAKYIIANRALISLAREIEHFRTNQTPARRIEAGVFIFNGSSARPVIPFGPFDEAAIERWAKGFSNPSGNTPLGNALTVAAGPVLASRLTRKHILVITDGVNTTGPTPASVLPGLTARARQNGTSLSTHFLAFDVDAKVFEGIKKRGATVVSAADEKQLDTQLQFILQKKILLEDEEPPKK